MAKLTLTDLTQLSSNESSAVAAINANNTATETAMENTLSRDGTSPNTMAADIDMDGTYTLINLPDATNNAEPVTLRQLNTSADGIVNVKEEGTTVVAAASDLNFVGAGVTATDGGSGTATITIPFQTFLQLTDTPSSYTAGQLYRVNSAGTALEAIGIGTEGQVLTVTSGVPVWAASPSATPWVQLERATFSTSSSENIGSTSVDPTLYDQYRLVINVTSISTDTVLNVWASSDGGTTKITTTNEIYGVTRVSNSTTHATFATTTTTLITTSIIDAAATNQAWNAEMIMAAPGNAQYKDTWTRSQFNTDAGATSTTQERCLLLNSTAEIDSFIMEPDSGTMTGSWVLLGLKKTV